MSGRLLLLAALSCNLLLTVSPGLLQAIERLPTQDREHETIVWLDNYDLAIRQAAEQGKLVLLWFVDDSWAKADAQFDRAVLQQPEIAERIGDRFVACRLSAGTTVMENHAEVKLLEHVAFEEMVKSPGFAILDLTDVQSPLHRRVVSVLPFRKEYPTADKLTVLLDLPPGSLTQRTLIYAVRTHPDRPASASSKLSPVLAEASESHATHQASITLQGHHQWESRFHAINARLPAGLISQEVCAESWPGQPLVEAAIECVDSWRQSPGHWEAVSTWPELFAYDMKRGHNGVWYAAGIFARKL